MRTLLEAAAQRAIRYLETRDARPVAPTAAAVAGLAALDEPTPERPTPPERVLEVLDEVCTPATMAISGGRFFGFVMGGAFPVGVAANWLATAWHQNTGLRAPTPATATLEDVATRWLLDLLGLPADCAAGFVTGATMANLTALAAARHAVLARAGWDVEADGLFGAPPITVLIGEEGHPTVFKSLGVLGLGRARVVKVPVDGQGRMRADALPAVSGPTIVIAQAGNINTGAIDPIGEICARVHSAGAWVHVDGAFGLWAAAAPSTRPMIAGYEQDDSWATDFHKWLNVPYDSGVALVRDAAALRGAMAVTAAYLTPGGQRHNPSDHTPELSRRARGVEVWAVLKALGRPGVAALVENACARARQFADGLRAAGYEILNDVVLNQVMVSFGDAATTERVIAAIQADGTCWCGGTVWRGRTAMRISVSSAATTPEEAERSLAAMLRCARGVAR